MLSTVASQAAIAIENARLHRSEVEKQRIEEEMKKEIKANRPFEKRVVDREQALQDALDEFNFTHAVNL